MPRADEWWKNPMRDEMDKLKSKNRKLRKELKAAKAAIPKPVEKTRIAASVVRGLNTNQWDQAACRGATADFWLKDFVRVPRSARDHSQARNHSQVSILLRGLWRLVCPHLSKQHDEIGWTCQHCGLSVDAWNYYGPPDYFY